MRSQKKVFKKKRILPCNYLPLTAFTWTKLTRQTSGYEQRALEKVAYNQGRKDGEYLMIMGIAGLATVVAVSLLRKFLRRT